MRGLQRTLGTKYCYSFIAYVNLTDPYQYTTCFIKYLKIVRRSLEVSYPELGGKACSIRALLDTLQSPVVPCIQCQMLRLGSEMSFSSLLVRWRMSPQYCLTAWDASRQELALARFHRGGRLLVPVEDWSSI